MYRCFCQKQGRVRSSETLNLWYPAVEMWRSVHGRVHFDLPPPVPWMMECSKVTRTKVGVFLGPAGKGFHGLTSTIPHLTFARFWVLTSTEKKTTINIRDSATVLSYKIMAMVLMKSLALTGPCLLPLCKVRPSSVGIIIKALVGIEALVCWEPGRLPASVASLVCCRQKLHPHPVCVKKWKENEMTLTT